MFLTLDQLHELTGLRQYAAMRRWLTRQGIPHRVRADGRPVVLEADLPTAGRKQPPPSLMPELPQKVDVRSLPQDLAALRALPWPIYQPGVYFLWKGDALVYVGQGVCVWNRVVEHEAARNGRRGPRAPRKDFDSATAIPIHPDQLDEVEYHYVRKFTPQCNIRMSPEAVCSRDY